MMEYDVSDMNEPDPNNPILASKGFWMLNKETGRKFEVSIPQPYDSDKYKLLSTVPHGDGDYFYMCNLKWCKCRS